MLKVKEKKSRSFSIKKVVDRIEGFLAVVSEDRVSVYAAQASFFIMISAIPFIMLAVSVIGSIIPEGVADVLVSMGDGFPENVRELYLNIISELYSRPAVNLISVTAVTAFWTASRGVAAVRGGISTVYGSHPDDGLVKRFLFSAAYTAAFLVLLILVILAQLFGEQLYWTMTNALPKTKPVLDFVFRFKAPVLFVFLSLFFALLYYAVNRKGAFVRGRLWAHLPGAILAAAGWLLFSYFFSLYTSYFTGASYIYGSLTAVILLLFWLYVCMIILLIGAEINKLFAERGRKKKQGDQT